MVKIILNSIIIISIIIVLYMIISVEHEKIKLKKGLINKVNNNKYIILITIIVVMFVIYGMLRNLV